MSDKFCFSVELRESSREAWFQSTTGEDYHVNYVVTKLNEISLSVNWLIPSKNLVKAELYNTDFELVSSQMRVEYGNKVHFKFCINSRKQRDEYSVDQSESDEHNIMFEITVVPYIETKDCATISEDEEVLNTSNEKIGNFSEPLFLDLAVDMRKLLDHGDWSDAKIINCDRAINVHAAILSARSLVFRNLLKDSSNEKVIKISDASAEGLMDMLLYVYSGLLKIKDMDRAEELYELAYKYSLEDLHTACSVYMSNCTADRVLQTLILAEKHGDEELKKDSLSFILKNLGEVKSSEKWESFARDNTDLMSEISSYISGTMEKEAIIGFMSRLSSKK